MSAGNTELGDLATKCIRCGFCLEACPTFRLTGDETQSPRGRIGLARQADAGKLDWIEAAGALDSCLGCRACEPACPSGVQFGAILEHARERLEIRRPRWRVRLLLWMATSPRLMVGLVRLGRRLGMRRAPANLGGYELPASTARRGNGESRGSEDQVRLLSGCAMPALCPATLDASAELLQSAGFAVASTEGCCGALHAHQGFLKEARRKAQAIGSQVPRDVPLVVPSAGCGAWLKEALADRTVLDLSEAVAGRLGGTAKVVSQGKVAFADPCHLKNGQRITEAPRQLLRAIGLDLVELDDGGACCGSAGLYSVLNPETARVFAEKKLDAAERAGVALLVTANPGCQLWLEKVAKSRPGIQVRPLAEVLEEALRR